MTLPNGTSDPRAKCKFCHKDYATSTRGTGHLRRHMYKCMPAHGQVDTTTQTQLQRHPDRSVTTWQFDAMHATECLARYIAQTDQPISIGESPFYKELITSVGLKQVSHQIDRIRDAISWICSSNPRFSEFKRHCKLNGLKPRRFQTDMPVRWNSTYLMLENCLKYDTTITCFYNMKLAETGQHSPKILTTDDWYVTKIFVQFLKIFYNATVTLSRVYYPTSSQAIHQIVEMFKLLNSYREDEHLGAAIVSMETKLKKYWANIPLLYALSAIVDPRVKLSGLEVLLEFIGINLSIDYSKQITDIGTKLFKIFRIYESRFDNIDTPQSTQPETEPKQTSWSLLKRQKKDKSASTSSGQRSSPSSCTELIRYLEAQFDAVEDKKEFDLLLWWKTYTYRYPVLSHLARDVLVIPVSTVSSEQAFSTSGRIIEPRRSCLSPEMVEVLTCLRDWEHAKKRLQNLTVDKELILNFNNLYIDDPAGSGQGQN
ncbi:hypothetical protein Ddye_001095 [Dipteronia dyeriana]|uniref:BED-type domain-containing protein n=1 Tax=Dipteronia dyeriana TaxID=168575 RepID=A0AAD9XMT6_9ROSI|nr:hypothetical protein Ddye_001095 [Dipteronia dyeriana]